MAYDSDPLDAELAAQGVEMISPHFAWLMHCRRLVTRYECKAKNFLGYRTSGQESLIFVSVRRTAS